MKQVRQYVWHYDGELPEENGNYLARVTEINMGDYHDRCFSEVDPTVMFTFYDSGEWFTSSGRLAKVSGWTEVPRPGQRVMVYDFVHEFAAALREQLMEDQERWGDTWLIRPRRGQIARLMERLTGYFADHIAGRPFPILKAVGYLYIAWVREHHPDLSTCWRD